MYLATNPNDTLFMVGFGDSFGSFGYGSPMDPYGGSSSFNSPFAGTGSNPFAGSGSSPFAGTGSSPYTSRPLTPSPFSDDPFGRRRLLQVDPFAAESGGAVSDPFAAQSGGAVADPFPPIAAATPVTPIRAAQPTTRAPPAKTPARLPGSTPLRTAAPTDDPFASPLPGSANDPFAANPTRPTRPTRPSLMDPFAPSDSQIPTDDPFALPIDDPLASRDSPFGNFGDNEVPLATNGTWDLSGGWITGMAAGNMKATSPIAFTTALLAWSYIAFPGGFGNAKQTATLRESVRWGADYLAKVHRFDSEKNTSMLITRVGDVDTELLLWYRPEDGAARPAYAVDLNAATLGGYGPAVGGDLGGSVAAALAASSTVFRSGNDPGDDEYAAFLLSKAKELYGSAKLAEGRFTDSDFNMTLLYNSTTVYDDLAWAAGWLYKATQDDAYLGDLYDFYVKHLQAEGELSDWKYVFDWDNVFWPLNVLMAQETGKGTFKKQSEQYLKSWMCANNAANYTQRGRAFNPESSEFFSLVFFAFFCFFTEGNLSAAYFYNATGTLGSTANTAMLALMYADIVESENAAAAETYRCWALSQLRYVLGDAGRSLVVGVGSNSPKRTQDRSAACPGPPAVCNRVTGLLSPDPDAYKLLGALLQGPGKSDDLLDVRSNDAARVGIENNVGFTGALAGAALLPDGMWEVCLQQFGIYRSNPVCGDFVSV